MADVQFINVTHPGGPGAASTRRANAHAARIAHARRRKAQSVVELSAKKEEKQPEKAPSPLSPLSSSRKDPFSVAARPLQRTERFLFDFYIQVVLPFQVYECKGMRDAHIFLGKARNDWTRLLLSRYDTLDAILLTACQQLGRRHRDDADDGAAKWRHYERLAAHYKVSCLRAVNAAISAEMASVISDATVAATLVLAIDEYWRSDIALVKRHLLGARRMIDHNGGSQTLGLNGFLEFLFVKLWADFPTPGSDGMGVRDYGAASRGLNFPMVNTA